MLLFKVTLATWDIAFSDFILNQIGSAVFRILQDILIQIRIWRDIIRIQDLSKWLLDFLEHSHLLIFFEVIETRERIALFQSALSLHYSVHI